MAQRSLKRIHSDDLHTRLRERREEIEGAILTRIQSDGAPTETADPEYAEGLRAAIPAALDYCLVGLERDEDRPAPFPIALLAQARVAARSGIDLDIVLRRYFAGYTLLGDFLVEEAEVVGLRRGSDLKRPLRSLAASFDRLLAAVSEEHARESTGCLSSTEALRSARVERLLAGELLDTSELAYDFDAHHLGAIASGPGAWEAICELASNFDRRLLAIRRHEGTVWAWLGGKGPIDFSELQRDASATLPPQASLALGEPSQGFAGWRLTHQQALSALPIALRDPKRLICYADVALLALMIQDDLLATSLRELYLVPLARERDGGKTLRETLRAYFAAGRCASSAAAVLKVKQHTVTSRLRTVEKRMGRRLTVCALEIDSALRLEDFGTSPSFTQSSKGE